MIAGIKISFLSKISWLILFVLAACVTVKVYNDSDQKAKSEGIHLLKKNKRDTLNLK